MCCSSYECEKLEKAFEGGTYDVVEKLIKRKLLDMTEFEQEVSDIVEYCKEHGENVAFDYAKRHAKTLLALAKKQLLSYADESNPAIEAMADLERTYLCNPDKLPKWLKDDIARKELNAHTRGYNKGYKDAEKQYNESVAYHYDDDLGKKHLEGYIMGREDTMREMKDFIESHFNTNKAKEGEDLTELYRKEYAQPLCLRNGGVCTNPMRDCINCIPTLERFNTSSGTSSATLQGNTSITDGKEHNPSFTD